MPGHLACKSDKMLPLAEPSRCNMATKAGYPSRGRNVQPCYGESKFKLTLPNINPCDGSIDSLYLCIYVNMNLCVCVCILEEEESMCVAHRFSHRHASLFVGAGGTCT